MATEGRRNLIEPSGAKSVILGGFGVVFKLSGEDTGGAFSVVERPPQPCALAAPPHSHTREDEFSLVLEGEIGVQLGDEVHRATAGT